MTRDNLPIIRKSQLIRDLQALGLTPGQIVMLHASVKAVGWIVGGPDVLLDALLDVLTPDGTLMMYVACEDCAYKMDRWPEEKRRAYLEELPPFDPATTRAHRPWSILTEYLRTRPGACRSGNPGWSMAAVGPKASWLTRDHPLQDGAGPGSPLEKLVQTGGQVLLLGCPLTEITVLHYAEYLADIPDKRTVRWQTPILTDGRTQWVQIQELDSSRGINDWISFDNILRDYFAAGHGRHGKVGSADCHLLEAADVVQYAARWMERKHRDLSKSRA